MPYKPTMYFCSRNDRLLNILYKKTKFKSTTWYHWLEKNVYDKSKDHVELNLPVNNISHEFNSRAIKSRWFLTVEGKFGWLCHLHSTTFYPQGEYQRKLIWRGHPKHQSELIAKLLDYWRWTDIVFWRAYLSVVFWLCSGCSIWRLQGCIGGHCTGSSCVLCEKEEKVNVKSESQEMIVFQLTLSILSQTNRFHKLYTRQNHFFDTWPLFEGKKRSAREV